MTKARSVKCKACRKKCKARCVVFDVCVDYVKVQICRSLALRTNATSRVRAYTPKFVQVAFSRQPLSMGASSPELA